MKIYHVITGPPNGPELFCSLASVVVGRLLSSVVVCNTAGGRTGDVLLFEGKLNFDLKCIIILMQTNALQQWCNRSIYKHQQARESEDAEQASPSQ